MYELLKSAISIGGYKLGEMQYKIKKFYLLGDLEEAQVDELLGLAAAGVSADAERPETLVLVKSLTEKIQALEARVTKLEDGGAGEPEQTEYPEWEPWDGLSDKYRKGAVVSHDGQLWESVFDGQNVWEPGIPGTESLWVKYVAESEETV